MSAQVPEFDEMAQAKDDEEEDELKKPFNLQFSS